MLADKLLYTRHEAMAALGLGRTTIHNAVRDGKLEGRKAGKKLLITADSIKAFADALPRVGKSA
jgi:excisionase family DNA binding protein